MAASHARGVLRRLLREAGGAPVALSRHGGATASARLGARSTHAAAVLPAPAGENQIAELRREILEVRREMLNENHHIWNSHDGLLKANHELREKMVLLQAQNIKNQMEAVKAMVKTSYCILGSCGGFMLAMFTVMTPLLKSAWQQETLELMDKRLRLAKIDTVLEDGSADAAELQSDKGLEKTTPPSGQVAAGTAGAAAVVCVKCLEKTTRPSGQVAAGTAGAAAVVCVKCLEKTTRPSGQVAAGSKSAKD